MQDGGTAIDSGPGADGTPSDSGGKPLAEGSTGGVTDGGSPLAFYALIYPATFGTLTPQTGAFVQIAAQQNGLVGGDLALSPSGTLYGLDTSRNLIVINPVAVTSTIVGPLSVNTGNGLDAFKFRKDGVLFGVSFTDLYTIDPSTAATTHVGSLGVSADPQDHESIDLAFDANGNLFFTATVGETPSTGNGPTGGTSTLYSVNTATGLATTIGPIGFGVLGTEFAEKTLYGFTNTSQVITIDMTTGAGTALSNETPAGIKVFAVAAAASASTVIVADGRATDAAFE
jgi:hypothetical protein